MERPLILGTVRRPRWRIAFARLLQEIGWAGLAGLALCAAAALLAASARELGAASLQRAHDAREQALPPVPLVEEAQRRPKIRLARRDEIPTLLARIERAATGNGLPWSAADYRVVAATDRQPGALEVRCAFKAPYPLLRAMLSEWIATLPAMTFREISFSRSDVGSAEVDAKFAIAVFLDDDPAGSPSAR